MTSKVVLYGAAHRSTMPEAALNNPLIVQALERGERALEELDREFGPERDIRQQVERTRASVNALTQDWAQWNGKTFAELKPIERHRLKAENRALYDLMRAQWCKETGEPMDVERTVRAGGRVVASQKHMPAPPAGSVPYEKLSNVARAELKAANPAAFEALRNDWLERGQP